ALAGRAFLRELATCRPSLVRDGQPVWSAADRAGLRETFDRAWAEFVRRVGVEALVLGVEPTGEPKRFRLGNAEPGKGEYDPAPYISWDSRYWNPHMEGTGGRGGSEYDTSLLVISEYRPGNIAPEDFLDRLLRKIGDPKSESLFERVVFDDV